MNNSHNAFKIKVKSILNEMCLNQLFNTAFGPYIYLKVYVTYEAQNSFYSA